jgi:hypothetical protein
MGFFDDVKDVVDDAKDKVEEETGIDIDRDGDTGSEPDNEPSQDVDPVEESADNIIDRNTGSGEESDSGSDSDSGGGGGSSFDPVEESADNIVDRNTGGDDNDSSSSSSSTSSSSSSSFGGSSSSSSAQEIDPVERSAEKIKAGNQEPEELDLEKTRTLQQDQTYSNTGRKVQGFLDQREQQLEAQTEIRSAKNKVKNAPENAEIQVGDKTYEQEEALGLLNDAENDLQQQKEKTGRSLESAFRQNDSPTERARNNADVNKITEPGGLEDTFDKPAEQALITGVEGLNYFENKADNINDFIPDSNDIERNQRQVIDTLEKNIPFETDQEDTEFFKDILPAPAPTTTATGIDSNIAQLGEITEAGFQRSETGLTFSAAASDTADIIAAGSGIVTTDTEETASKNLASGAATGLPILGSFGLAAVGGTGMAIKDDTPSLAEGAAKGPVLVGEEAEKNPTEFISSEIGEEVGETVGTLGIGAAVPTITPEITPTPDPDSPTALDRAAAKALPGNDLLIADTETGSTPDFVNDFEVQTVEPEPVAQPMPLADARPEPEPEIETSSNSMPRGMQISMGTPFMEDIGAQAPSRPEAVNQARPDTVPQIESFIEARAEPIPDTRAETFTGSRTSVLDFDMRAEPRIETRPEPGTRRTPQSDFGNEPFDDFLGDFEDEPREQLPDEKGEFAPSLTAGLFDIQAEEDFDEEEFVGTGTEIRPLTEDFL